MIITVGIRFFDPDSQLIRFIMTCLNGSGFSILFDNGSNYNHRRALLAVLRGGILGTGTGIDSIYQLHNYAAKTDYSFLTICSTFGAAAGFVTLLSLIMIIINSGVSIRSAGNGNIISHLAGNLCPVYIFAQTALHVLGNLSLIPFTGVTLPFISAGGTSLISSFIIIGLILGNARSHQAELFGIRLPHMLKREVRSNEI